MLRRIPVLLLLVVLGWMPRESHAQFTVSGTISAAAGTSMDSDVNDPNAPFLQNDTTGSSQLIVAPASVGGYVNSPGAGPAGRSKFSGDTVDAFRTFLAEGFIVTLSIAEQDAVVHDLDLLLLDAGDPSNPVVASSLGTERVESVTVPADGEYFVVVTISPTATEAATNYLLVLGLEPSASQASEAGLSLEYEFAPSQTIVRFRENAQASAAAPSLPERAVALGLRGLAGGAGRQMLFELGVGRERARAMGAMMSGAARARVEAWMPKDPATREKLETIWLIKKLRSRGDVTIAEPNYRRHPTVIPNDEFYPIQWHYPRINLPEAWESTTGSPDTIVAVIDTGVLRNHPDLQGSLPSAVGSGYDFIRLPSISADGDGIDPFWDDPGDGGGNPSSFHGTHVSGTIAAATNNFTGVSGINWNATIMPLRVLGVGGGFSYDIQQAVRYAAGLPNDSGTVPPQRADVMNLSLGGGGSSLSEQQTYLEARNEGVIIVAAAGNDDSQIPSYPAAYDGVVSVSATDYVNNRAQYSNFGATIDVAAPGGEIPADVNGDGYVDGVLSTLGEDIGPGIEFIYRFYQGTSMASPHVAGVASLMKGIDPDLTPDEFDMMLAAGELTTDLGSPGRDDEFGYGLINALKAVNAAGAPPASDPVLVVTPKSLNFGLLLTSAEISVLNVGGGAVSIGTISDDSGGWLTVTPLDADPASGLGSYTVEVDRGGLANGLYTATITFDSTAGPVEALVVMVAGLSLDLNVDAGFHYIRLLDATTQETVVEISEPVDDVGNYTFSFTDVPSGTYLLVAGTDSNNDSLICKAAEACGGYPVLNELEAISVDEDVSGLEFVTRFRSILLPEPSFGSLLLVGVLALGGLDRRARTKLQKNHRLKQ
jgi:serine protease